MQWKTSINISPSLSTSLSIQLKEAERITVSAGRDGGLHNMEVLGMITLKITDQEFNRIQITIDSKEERGVQFQVSYQ